VQIELINTGLTRPFGGFLALRYVASHQPIL